VTRKLAALLTCIPLVCNGAQAAQIVWVSFHADENSPTPAAAAAGFTQAPDAGYTQLLRTNGHNVARMVSSGTPDTNLLNAADLVIISRSVPSVDYETDAETAVWHGIKTPMIILGGYVLRSNRLGFTTDITIPDTVGSVRLIVHNPAHPIFAGIALDNNHTMVSNYADPVFFNSVEQRGISVNTSSLAGGGTVLATVGTPNDPAVGGMVIGEWQAGSIMGTTPPDTLGGRRLVFLTGSREDANLTPEGTGIYDLTPEGAQMFLNAVNYMTPPPTYSGAVLSDAPIVYYRFSDPSSNAVNSGTLGASASGTYLNGATSGVQAPRPPQFSGFESNNTALQLDGLDDFMRGTAGLLNGRSNVTLSAWIRRSGTQRNRSGVIGQDNVIEFGYIANNTLQAWVDDFSGPVNVTNPFPDLEWEHIALVVDSQNLRMTVYTNSTFAGTTNLPSANYSANTNFFVVGGDAFGMGVSFGGQIDEAAVFDKALTADQIVAHYYSAVISAPRLRVEPVGTNILQGQTLRLAAEAVGSPKLRYQWLRGGVPVPGQTAATLVISNAAAELSGSYSVSVENGIGSVQSATVAVNVINHLPVALCQNVTNIVCAGCQAVVTADDVDNGSSDPDGIIVNSVLSPPGPYPPGVTEVTLAVIDDDGGTNTCTANIVVIEQFPPIVKVSPALTNVPPGGSVTFCAAIEGVGPFQIQWRHNGVNIPDETNACLHIPSVELSHGGTYSVIVANDAGAVLSDPVQLLLEIPTFQGSDSVTNRIFVGGDTGLITGTNTLASADPNEPRHFGKPGGKSVWYQWSSTETGVATFTTRGSTFDTLLAVYVQCGPDNLVEVASDDDSGGNLASLVQFNVIAGTNYLIAVDGFGGADGQFSLSWEFESVPVLLPQIVTQPKSLTVGPGQNARFSVEAVPGCRECSPCGTIITIGVLEYQWYRDGEAIPGATESSYLVTEADESDVGNYTVSITQNGQKILSRPAALQLNITGEETQPVQAQNKFEDAAEMAGIELGIGTAGIPPLQGPARIAAAGTVVRGYTGSQIFSTSGSTGESGDHPVCGVIGGASQWLTFVPLQNGALHLNTDGSSYNTVMAVFVRSATNAAVLQFVDCDNNSGADGRDSALDVPAQAGQTNFIMIDGVNGQTGTLHLNYSLVITSAITVLGLTPQGHPQLRITGRPELRFTLEVSDDMVTWTPLSTNSSTTGTVDYTDTTTPPDVQRLYRALMLP
jgi:hypothetical protein